LASAVEKGRKRLSGTSTSLLKEAIFSDQAWNNSIEELINFNRDTKE
jgi:hypothetical protein